jgi:hypothetical protein
VKGEARAATKAPKWPRAKSKAALWLMGALLASRVARADAVDVGARPAGSQAQPGESAESARGSHAADVRAWPVPRPAPTSRKTLPVAFTKAAPTSLADLKSM